MRTETKRKTAGADFCSMIRLSMPREIEAEQVDGLVGLGAFPLDIEATARIGLDDVVFHAPQGAA